MGSRAKPKALTRRQVDSHRASIGIGVILDRLQKHTQGKLDMSSTQVRAAEILLRKTIPDLSSIEHSTDPENPLISRVEQHIIDPKG